MSLGRLAGIAFLVWPMAHGMVRGQAPAPPMDTGRQPLQHKEVTIRGIVVDDDGKSVVDADVGGFFWIVVGNGSSCGPLNGAKSNALGEFTMNVAWISEASTLSIRAWKDGAFTVKALELKGDATKTPLRLTISKKNARGVTGRVVNETGDGVAGATIDLFHVANVWPGYESNHGKSIRDKLPIVETDADGKFAIAGQLDPDGSYRVQVQSADHLPAKSAWKKMDNAATLDLGTLTAHRMQLLQGKVVDRQGQPLAGALVVRADSRMRVTATTDAQGQFQLKMAMQPVGVLAVIKDGYRTAGRRCDVVEKMNITLTRRDEPAGHKMALLSPTLSLDERKNRATKLLEADWQAAQASDKDEERSQPLQWRAALDPTGVLEVLDKKPLKDGWYDGYTRRAVAKCLARDSFDDARAVVDSIRDPSFRAMGYIDLHDRLGPDRKAEKIGCLDQALLHAKAIAQTDHRIIYIGRVARRLMELDETARGTALLRDDHATAKNLPTEGWGAYARGSFAENFGLVDLPAALELLDGLKDPMAFTRHTGNLACQLAATQPEKAEEVFNRLLNNEMSAANAGSHLMRLCFQLARHDAARAKRMIATIKEPLNQAQAHGAIARALAKTNPKDALDALDQAFTILEAHANAGKDQFNNLYHGSAIAGLLIPVAEQIDPSLAAEFFWRAAALGGTPLHEGIRDDENMLAESIGATAMVLAPYDHKLAAELAEQAASFHRDRYAHNNYIKAIAVADPARINDLLDKVPNPAARGSARRDAAGMLLTSGDSMFRQLHRVLFIWHPADIDE